MDPLQTLRPLARRMDRHVDIVRHIARLLDSTSSSRQVKRVLRTYLNRLQGETPRPGRGAVTGGFIDHVVKVSNRYWSGLFHAYDDPRIPRTTNGLEGFFGSSKNGIRRTTGRMSTAGGKFESCGEAVVRIQALLQTMPPDALAQRLAAVAPQSYRESKRRLRRLQHPARERRSIQRNPQRYLDRVLDEWLDSG